MKTGGRRGTADDGEETESPRCAGERSEEGIGVSKIVHGLRQASAVDVCCSAARSAVSSSEGGYNGMESLRIIFNRPSLSVACGSCTSHFVTLPGCVRQTFSLFFSGGRCDNPEPMAAGHVAGDAFVPAVPALASRFSAVVLQEVELFFVVTSLLGGYLWN